MRKPPHGCSETAARAQQVQVVWQEPPWLAMPLVQLAGEVPLSQGISRPAWPMAVEVLPGVVSLLVRRMGLLLRMGYMAGICLVYMTREAGRSPMVSQLVEETIEQALPCSEVQQVVLQALARR